MYWRETIDIPCTAETSDCCQDSTELESNVPLLLSLMSRRRRVIQDYLAFIAVALLCVNSMYKLAGLYWMNYHRHTSGPAPESTSHEGLEVIKRPVQMQLDYSLHYSLNASHAWAALVPRDGLIYLGQEHKPFMVSMLHQLRCLGIINEQLLVARDDRHEDILHHCMNYLRQMTLCRCDTFLDPYQYPSKILALNPHPVRRCQDWQAVYEAVEVNQKKHVEWLNEQV
ncbi:hypothetical protein BKA93DRAFT_154222 [Sparassis latifolia]